MPHALRAALALAAALLLASCAALSERMPDLPRFRGEAAATAEAAAPRPAGAWPQAASDVEADPAVRFGALPNGMRYALRRQTVPEGQAAVRLWIDAGSLMEAEDQRGLAHFLEHMAFNGSKAVPEGEMIKMLERLGLAFGADTNASTGFDETIYKLDLPNTDEETIDASLMLMRETASELLIEPDAVDRERGVVISEERSRDSPPYRVYVEQVRFQLKDQLPPNRLPIGQVEVLRSAPASRIADFYRAYYRPENAVLVAVGDFDLDTMEAKVRDRFEDWRGQGPAGARPALGDVADRDVEAKLVVEPGAAPSLQLAWIRDPDLAPDTRANRRRQVLERLGLAVLNRRFSSLSRGASPPFIGAAGFQRDDMEAAELGVLIANAQQGRWREALNALEQEQRRLMRHGVRQDELDREIVQARADLEADVAGAATRRPSALAAEILSALPGDDVVTSPAQDLALFDEIVEGLTAEEVSQAVRRVFEGEGPLLFVVSPTPIQGGEATLLSALESSRRTEVGPPEALAALDWPYERFGAPGKVVEERDLPDLDAVLVRFENGVRLTVKPTRFRDDEILVRVNIGHGLMDLPADRQSLGWYGGAYVEGGLGKITAEDMERVLASKVYGVRFGLGDDAFVLSGSTRPEHLDTQMQVLTAYAADPGWRPEAFERYQTAAATIHDQYEATPNGVLSRELAGRLHAGDGRWTFPTRAEMRNARLEDLKAQIAQPLATGPIEVVIVGDTTVEKATEAVAQTLGALPPRPDRPAPAPRAGYPDPTAEPIVLTHKGRDDQAVGYVAWRTDDFFADVQAARDTSIMGEVLRLRLIEELREGQGATYSPNVNYAHSYVWPDWGYMGVSVEVPPDRLPAFFADVDKIAAQLRSQPISDDELARARLPRLERIAKAQVTNEYWLSELSGAQADPRRVAAIRSLVAGLERVTAADIQAAARRYLDPDKAWKLMVRPD